MNSKKKLIALCTSIFLVVALIVAFAIIGGASEATPTLNLKSAGLNLESKIEMFFRIDAKYTDDVDLLVWTTPQSEYTFANQEIVIADPRYVDDNGYLTFFFDEYPAKQMTKEVYIRAYSQVDGIDYYSEVQKYSILQYCYNKLNSTKADDIAIQPLVEKVLNYGAKAQVNFNVNVDRLANDNWQQIKVVGGTLDDGFAKGLYLPGDTPTITAPDADGTGKFFSHWINSAGDSVSTDPNCKITVGEAPETYSAVYSANTKIVIQDSLNMIPVNATSDNASVATATVADDYEYVTIKGIGAGNATVTIYDDFGNGVPVDVTVDANKRVTLSPITPFYKANSLNLILDCGAVPNDTLADTAVVQAAIDQLAANGGGTLYIPRGTYYTGLLQIKENVHLVLAGQVPNADISKGYTAEVKARVDGGEFAILKALDHDMFHNLKAGSHGTTGIDNYSIKGGVLDMQGKSRCILFVCADNASMSNVIMKDCLNDHAIQVTGSTNITIQNIMFAGYNVGSNLTTGEEVQIEAGCNGATGGNIAVFGDAEYYFSKNVLIDNCYFGPSDKYGSQTIAIGHHGYRNKSDANGLTISNCVFDNNKTWSIKTASYSNVKILNNTFISESDNRVAYNDYESFIYITISNGDIKGNPDPTGASSSANAFLAKKQSCEGSQNIEISGNTFKMSGDVVSRYVIYANSNSAYKDTVGAETVVDMLKYIEYGTPAKYYTGYIPVQNVIYNLVVKNNTIDINCASAGSGNLANYFLKFNHIVGLTMVDNKITSNVTFGHSNAHNNINGVSIYNCLFGADMYTRTIKMASFSDSSIGVMLPNSSGKNVKLTASGTPTLTLKSDGNGEIVLVYGDNGSVTATLVPKEGYHFTGWTKDGAAYNPTSDVTVSSSMTLVANFAK